GRGRMEDVLRKAGIPGIKYLDQGSRDAGEGTRNYVVFDDSLIEIVAKDGKPVSNQEKQDIVAASLASIPSQPQPRSFNIEGFSGTVTSSVDENGNRVRTYRVGVGDEEPRIIPMEAVPRYDQRMRATIEFGSAVDLDRRLYSSEANDGLEDRIRFLVPSEFRHEQHFAARIGDRVVGVGGIEESPSESDVLWVKFVAVDSAYRNRGIATQIVAQI